MKSVKVNRTIKENTQSLVRRFVRGVRQSGILIEAKKDCFRERPQSPKAKKMAALRKVELTEKYERLKKQGMMKPRNGRNK